MVLRLKNLVLVASPPINHKIKNSLVLVANPPIKHKIKNSLVLSWWLAPPIKHKN